MKIKHLTLSLSLLSATIVIPAFADNSSVTVPLQMVSTQPGSYQAGVHISVAGGPSTLVLFDTGSSGLHIFANQVGAQGLVKTNKTVVNGYGDGEMYSGVIAYAPVTIGGVTTGNIPIVLVNKVYCAQNKPDCPVAHEDPTNPSPDAGFFYGTMGVSMQPQPTKGMPKAGLYSPLRALPGNYGNGFIIKGMNTQGGSLVIGLNPSNSQGFSKVQLDPMGKYSDGVTAYNDKTLNVHYQIGNLNRDFKTAFDTGGNSSVHFFAPNNLGLPVTKRKSVKPGLDFEATLANGFDWSFTTGKDAGVNLVTIKPLLGNKGTYINTGITFFFDYDVIYDVQNGMLGFAPHN